MRGLRPSFILPGLLAIPTLVAADAMVHGRVVDENDKPVAAAHVSVHVANSTASFQATTDPTGGFTVTLPSPGDFLFNIEREGFYALKDRPIRVDGPQDLTLVINTVREVFQSQNVQEQTSPLDVGQPQSQDRLTGTEVNDVPYANSHSLRNSLPLIPGVINDQSGTLHVNGSSENQVQYLLNGFDITNPITGQFQTLVAVEGVHAVDLSSGRSSPEFGKGTAGVLNISTETGTDHFHYTSTDFIPGINIQHGARLGNWYPRFGVSGPILRGRAWFSDTVEGEYQNSYVTGLPNGQNTRSGFIGSNLLHTQWNVTPSNILFADFLANVDNEGRVGLGVLNPISTTSNLHNHEYFVSAKDQKYLGRGVLVEFGYAHNEYFSSQSPQGDNLYIIGTTGYSGNYFQNDTQSASRDQGMLHVYLPRFKFAGSHQFEVGTSVDWLNYSGKFARTGYQVLGLSGQLLSQTLFPTPARFSTTDNEVSGYVLDTWRASKTLQFNLGVREDWDRRIGANAWSPRAAFAWSPFSTRTRISGGFAITHDAVTMGMLGAPLDQAAVTTVYNAEGLPSGPPAVTTFAIPNSGLVLPRATNWTLDADRQLFMHIYFAAKYLRRRGADEFDFVNTLDPNAPPSLLPVPGTDASGIYRLANLRRDDYDSVTISIRQTLTGQFEWMAAYTHSRAVSNAVLDPNAPEPLQVLQNLVPMPWDAPNRIIGWGYLPLPWKNWAVSFMADARSGFPFSVRDQTGVIMGVVDSHRYPVNFDLNLALERMITLHGYRFALRGGMDNVTNQSNPTAVNNVVGGPQYLQFLGDEGRHFVVRIRFFGRAGGK